MPLLFQRPIGSENRAFTPSAIRKLLISALVTTGLTDAAGDPLMFSPHDFRRILRNRCHHERPAAPHRPGHLRAQEAESPGRHMRPRVRVTLCPRTRVLNRNDLELGLEPSMSQADNGEFTSIARRDLPLPRRLSRKRFHGPDTMVRLRVDAYEPARAEAGT